MSDQGTPKPAQGHGWFARRSVGTKLSIGFTTLILITLIVVLAGFGAADRVATDIERTLSVRAPIAATSEQARTDLLRLLGAVQGYLSLGQQSYRDDYAAALGALHADLDDFDDVLRRRAEAYPEEAGAAVGARIRIESVHAALLELEPLVAELFALRDDQLEREPALRMLIQDAGPPIGRTLSASGELIRLEAERDPTPQSVRRLADLSRFQSTFLASALGLRGYVTTGRQAFRFEYDAGRSAAQSAWDDVLSSGVPSDPIEVGNIETVTASLGALEDFGSEMLDIVGSDQARVDLYRLQTEVVPLTDRMLGELESTASEQAALLREELSDNSEALSSTVVATVAIGLAGVFVAAALAFLIWRAISPPIRRLTSAAEQVAGGDLSTRATIESADEIGTLATTFNEMTGRLETTVGELNDTNEAQARYIEQVKLVTDAAEALETDEFNGEALDGVVGRDDALGVLALTFQRMAREVKAREATLLAQVRELRIEIDERRQSEKVAEITDTEYFRSLRGRASRLRGIVRSDAAHPDSEEPDSERP